MEIWKMWRKTDLFSLFLYVYCDIVLDYLHGNGQPALGDRIKEE